ncbi:PQQ-binding-like beta-propeller repeat protein [Halobellus marinus]|uniref:outer membrane protein assembly factor BamB family protein n=1 Tax=Halobellus marinus TaxID=3075123 RepID=UPI003CE49FE4
MYATGEDTSITAFGIDGAPEWRFETDGSVDSSPVVVDGTVYVGSMDNHVYALDAASGTEQ